MFMMKQMSDRRLSRARCETWCSTSTSSGIRSFRPAADMQCTTQRWKALLATIRPNSNSLISALWGETRCADDTMCEPGALAAGVVVALGVLAMCSPAMAPSLDFLLMICQQFVDDKGKHPSQSASPAPTVRAPFPAGSACNLFHLTHRSSYETSRIPTLDGRCRARTFDLGVCPGQVGSGHRLPGRSE